MWCGLLVRLPLKDETCAKNPLRIESCPPARFRHSQGLLDRCVDRMRGWLNEGFHRTSRSPYRDTAFEDFMPTPETTLAAVRIEFASMLDDIPTRAANELDARIHEARSLHELWHLRADVFNVVSWHSSQNEARERLSQLNRHFPTRAPRSGFGGFDVTPQRRWKS